MTMLMTMLISRVVFILPNYKPYSKNDETLLWLCLLASDRFCIDPQGTMLVALQTVLIVFSEVV